MNDAWLAAWYFFFSRTKKKRLFKKKKIKRKRWVWLEVDIHFFDHGNRSQVVFFCFYKQWKVNDNGRTPTLFWWMVSCPLVFLHFIALWGLLIAAVLGLLMWIRIKSSLFWRFLSAGKKMVHFIGFFSFSSFYVMFILFYFILSEVPFRWGLESCPILVIYNCWAFIFQVWLIPAASLLKFNVVHSPLL